MRAGASPLNSTALPVWDGTRHALRPCNHEYDPSENVILIEPVLGLDMCCRCGAVFGRNDALATEEDYRRIVAAYTLGECVNPTPHDPGLWGRWTGSP